MKNVGGPVVTAFIIHSKVCAEGDQAFLAQLIGVSIFMSGLCTLLQVTFGIRFELEPNCVLCYVNCVSY